MKSKLSDTELRLHAHQIHIRRCTPGARHTPISRSNVEVGAVGVVMVVVAAMEQIQVHPVLEAMMHDDHLRRSCCKPPVWQQVQTQTSVYFLQSLVRDPSLLLPRR